MAANRFATMLHENNHRIIVVLVYAVLEWILILLLLVNSLFSYFIRKFAKFFGLKPPCPLCSTLDHVLEPENKPNNSSHDHVFEAHGEEISKFNYCYDLCAACSASRGLQIAGGGENLSRVALSRRIHVNGLEKCGDNVECSCYDESMSRKVYIPSVIFKSFWDVLESIHKKSSVTETINEGRNGEKNDTSCQSKAEYLDEDFSHVMSVEKRNEGDDIEENTRFGSGEYPNSDVSFEEGLDEESSPNSEQEGRFKLGIQEGLLENHDKIEFLHQSKDKSFVDKTSHRDDEESLYIPNFPLKNEENVDSDQFVSLGVIDGTCNGEKLFAQRNEDIVEMPVGEAKDVEMEDFATNGGYIMGESSQGDSTRSSITVENEMGVVWTKEVGIYKNLGISNTVMKDIDGISVSAEADQENCSMLSVEDEFKIIMDQENVSRANNEHGQEKLENTYIQESINHNISETLEAKQVEEEKSLCLATVACNLHPICKKVENRVLGTEEDSCRGSIINDVEGDIECLTGEQLKEALKTQHEVLSKLYAELEEERNSAAVATKETMAMITKLQEEKAEMQMEALQYQRMMEEQAEYDQEAMQLLNDLMVKREKEKQELEKELEMYREKVLEYEIKERMMIMRCRNSSFKSTPSPVSSKFGKNGDENSIDLNREYDDSCSEALQERKYEVDLSGGLEDLEERGALCNVNFNTPDISFVEFEVEKLCILEELKSLEAKLFALVDEEEEYLGEDVKPSENETCGNKKVLDEYNSCCPEENMTLAIYSDDLNGKDREGENLTGLMAKRVLPLLVGSEVKGLNKEKTDDLPMWGRRYSFGGNEFGNDEFSIREELANVYERLQSIEADREFLKYCVNSLKKGDKGMVLLQEILQHLRDLRSVELLGRSLSESTLA